MVRYGETPSEFRPRPSWPVLIIVATGLLVIARALASIGYWLVQTLLAVWSGWHGLIVIFVNVVSDPSLPLYTWPPLVGDSEMIEGVLAGAGIATALGITWFWPASGRLSSQIFIRIAGFELIRLFAFAPAVKTLAGPSPSIVAIGSSAAALLASWLIATHLLKTFGQPFDTTRKGTRMALVLAMSTGFVAIGVIESLAGYLEGAIAAIIVILVLSFRFFLQPPRGLERVHDSELKTSRFAAPVLGLAAISILIALFGCPPLGLEHRAITVRDGKVSMRSIDDLLAEQLRLPEGLEERDAGFIRWSGDEQPAAPEEATDPRAEP